MGVERRHAGAVRVFTAVEAGDEFRVGSNRASVGGCDWGLAGVRVDPRGCVVRGDPVAELRGERGGVVARGWGVCARG